MGTVIDLESQQGAWFEMEGGGRVELRNMPVEEFKAVKKQTTKKKVDFKRLDDGKAERFEYEEVNEDLQNELFWDAVIVGWENFLDGKGNEIPCTKENKVLLMTHSSKFAKFVADSLKTLTEDEAAQAGEKAKN